MTVAPDRSTLLEGSVALVTGASSGLGARFARTLAAAGAKVALVARRADRLAGLVEEIRAAGGTAMALPLDIADAAAIPGAVAAAEAELGLVDILVNNAGIADVRPLVEQDPAEIERMYAVNLRAPLLFAQAVGARLIAEGKPGRVVNISSMAAYHYDGRSPCVMYAATKAAVARMTETLAVEWARHRINVNAIAPGFFRSEMSAATLEGREERIAGKMPRGRIGEPHQMDSTLLYLVSPRSEVVTGTCIRVEDGQMPR
ncbi:SDR family NAD(P)-dependent oxidoreductase [Sphingomonas sp. CL5.1]|uniref:SDR family NAD(P)-dependent oxidoreductase n=1 Tax=Sphingomonas sp. CL5.1 TaxID=2653203 RepID=UPI001582FB42|nr:SDR family NAD(P)-dependent oxidoreductase [Sphingomonas sp. CL5.1]QKR98405.1 SDR family NAD(P)-dependent oxidoreductase [Sphingomonas sp. CL5.1]